MSNKIVFFKDIVKEEWDHYVDQIDETSFAHSWSVLNYFSKFSNIAEHNSFVYLENNNTPLAICPLAITFNATDNISEVSFNGTPVSVPALRSARPSARRKLLNAIFDVIQGIVKKHNVKMVKMVRHAINKECCLNNYITSHNLFELHRYHMLYYVQNTLIIDLSLANDKLNDNVSKYLRRYIKRSEKRGVKINIFNSNNNADKLKELFYKFQSAHATATGGITRPQLTWDCQYKRMLNEEATLFVAFVDETPVSYLYCTEFYCFAIGASQVNIKEFEKFYSPRHLLEWTAILYYKGNGFKYYEVGERSYGPQLLYIPTEKEISISDFKERFGGMELPKVYWIGYCDDFYMEKAISYRLDNYFKSKNIMFH